MLLEGPGLAQPSPASRRPERLFRAALGVEQQRAQFGGDEAHCSMAEDRAAQDRKVLRQEVLANDGNRGSDALQGLRRHLLLRPGMPAEALEGGGTTGVQGLELRLPKWRWRGCGRRIIIHAENAGGAGTAGAAAAAAAAAVLLPPLLLLLLSKRVVRRLLPLGPDDRAPRVVCPPFTKKREEEEEEEEEEPEQEGGRHVVEVPRGRGAAPGLAALSAKRRGARAGGDGSDAGAISCRRTASLSPQRPTTLSSRGWWRQ